MREVGIVGVGMTKFGVLGRVTSRELITSSAKEALEMAGIKRDEVDAIYNGILSPDIFEHQMHSGPGIPDYLGLKNTPSTRVEAACASGGLAVMQGIIAVSSGIYDTVLANGAEKMTNLPTSHVTEALAMCADNEYEVSLGITFPGAFAMIARAHEKEYGTNAEMRAAVAVKNHKHGLHNELGQFQKEITMEKAMNSLMIADPLRLYDCSPITDGAASVVIVPWEQAKKMDGPKIKVRSFAQASDTMSLHDRPDITGFTTTKVAARKAYERANLKPTDIDFVEVHDCFTIAEIVALEDMGFFKKGEAGPAILAGDTYKDGAMPVNLSGGLKSKGHPIGATGVSQIVEVFKQLNDMAHNRQLKDANIGMTQNLGGSGSTIVTHIFERGN
ncbi:MAG: thiolase domain-containing protein [Candidatus Heimdallarchaeota archaeon]|nr:thiolase domain-containing protein [Candidatus Heimdallarchaeota archaeon]